MTDDKIREAMERIASQAPTDPPPLDAVIKLGKRRRARGVALNIGVLVLLVSAAVPTVDWLMDRTTREVVPDVLPTEPSPTEPSPTVTPASAPCEVPLLDPTYLPTGFAQSAAPTVRGAPPQGWAKAWAKGSSRIELQGGMSGDFGDDPSVRGGTVRGWGAAYSPPAGILVWTESAPEGCLGAGGFPYAVYYEGVADEDALRFANGLRRPRLGARPDCGPEALKVHTQQRPSDGEYVVVDINFSSDVTCYVAVDLKIQLVDVSTARPTGGVEPVTVLVNGNFPEDGSIDETQPSDMVVTVRWRNWCGPREGRGLRLQGLGLNLTSPIRGSPSCGDATMMTSLSV